MTAEQPESTASLLAVEMLESAINLVLADQRDAADRLAPHVGKVVRVKTRDPHAVFFITLCEQGVMLSTHHEEQVDARIRVAASDLAKLFVRGASALDGSDGSSAVRLAGDQALLEDLLEVAVQFDLWHLTRRVIQRWIPEFTSLDDLLRIIRDQDPAWMARLEHLPQLTHEAYQAIRELQSLQQRQMEELLWLRRQIERDRLSGQISTGIGLLLIVTAFLLHGAERGVLQGELQPSLEHWVMLIVAMVLLVPRLMGRR